MSEFSDGVLFLKKHTDMARSALQSLNKPYRLKEINQQWSAVFVEEANPKVDPLRGWMIEQSSSFPILFFEHPEDHGWGYRVFYDGEETASLFVSYELSYSMYIDVVQNRFPDVDPHIGIEQKKARAIREAVITSDAYRQRAAAQFRNRNVEQFSHFEFSDEVLRELEQVVTIDWYLDKDKQLQQVQEFKRLTNIREVSWMSYRYITRDE